MPLFPLPPEGAIPSGGDLPVSSADDALALVPAYLRPDDPAPVRDAIVAFLTQLSFECQDAAAYAAAQSDPLRATGAYLDEIGGEERGTFRQGDETEVYRARVFNAGVVTPTAILAGVNALLAPYTKVQCRYAEGGDFWFVRKRSSGTSAPWAFVYKRATRAPQSPEYPDRLYPSEAAEHGGFSIPGREPGDTRPHPDRVRRLFLLRVPDLTSLDAEDTPVYVDTSVTTGPDFSIGTGDGVTGGASFVLQDATTSAALYASIVNVVTRLGGQSIRWILLVDPKLTS